MVSRMYRFSGDPERCWKSSEGPSSSPAWPERPAFAQRRMAQQRRLVLPVRSWPLLCCIAPSLRNGLCQLISIPLQMKAVDLLQLIDPLAREGPHSRDSATHPSHNACGGVAVTPQVHSHAYGIDWLPVCEFENGKTDRYCLCRRHSGADSLVKLPPYPLFFSIPLFYFL